MSNIAWYEVSIFIEYLDFIRSEFILVDALHILYLIFYSASKDFRTNGKQLFLDPIGIILILHINVEMDY